MNCPDCDRELTSHKCRCGYVSKSPVHVDRKDEHTCKGHGCFRPWTINGFCRDCWQRVNGKSREQGSLNREALDKLKQMVGSIGKKLPYDPRKRHA